MLKRWTLLPLALGLSLCLLTGCQQSTDTGTDSTDVISESQLYATARSTFLQEQAQQLQEMDVLLQELEQLKPEDTYALGHLTGRAAADRNWGDAYRSLCLNTPEQVVQQLVPTEQGKANEAYASARLNFLEALAAQTDAADLTSSELTTALPALREAFDKINLTQRQLEDLDSISDTAVTDYIRNIQNFTAQLNQVTALLQ